MASELCMNCFSVKGQYEVCPFCGYVEGTPPAQPHYLMPGTILSNHFIIGTAIGFGGFGITYKAYDTTLGVIVAVKEFYPAGLVNRAPGENAVGLLSGEKRQQYQMQLKRFLMEAQSIAQFGKAKDIVNVYDYFEANNTAYIIMEYVDGVLLKDYLERQGKMEPEMALAVITPIIEAVKKIHAQGIIHRDISPDNIFIDGEESIKVFDFGAAQLNNSSEGKAGEKVIKVGYSAPEQYRDKSQQGFYTDIYSVGAILYQMVTGEKPMESTEREYKDELPSPMELGIQIEPNIDRAIMEALAVKPELRFQGIQQFDDALNSKRIAEYPKEKLKKRKRRRNWIISTAATIVLAVGVGIALFNTVLKPTNEMMDAGLSEDTITIWVEDGVTKAKLERIASQNFVMGDNNDVDKIPEKTREILKENEKITVKVEDVSLKKDSNGKPYTVDKRLKEAKAQGDQGAMPDMFITDLVTDPEQYGLVSLEDTVYQALEPSEYLYFSEYKDYFQNMKEMPTGIDATFLFAYDLHINENNVNTKDKDLKTSQFYKRTDTDTIELSEILAENAKEESSKQNPDGRAEYTMVHSHAAELPLLMCTGIMHCGDGEDSFFNSRSGELKPNTALIDYLSVNYNTIYLSPLLKSLTTSGSSQNTEVVKDTIGNSLFGGARSRWYLSGLMANAEQGQVTINRLKGYKPFVVTQDGRMQILFSDRYAILEGSSRNRQLACMRFLWIMMGEPAQANNFESSGHTPFPINAKSFEEFFKFNPIFECFQKVVKDKQPCTIIGKGTGDLFNFETGIDTEYWTKAQSGDSVTLVLSPEKAKEYCTDYVQTRNAEQAQSAEKK